MAELLAQLASALHLLSDDVVMISSSRRTNQNEDLNTIAVLLNQLLVQFVVNFSMHAESDTSIAPGSIV